MAMEDEVANSRFKQICVYCGSQSGNKASYKEAAIELGNEMVKRKIDLVYGGGSVGLMGLVSQAVHDGGRHVLGIIPKSLMPREITGETKGEVMMVSNMHQRKAEMARQADAFIALPGGYGTLEELLEVITWVQLGIHRKPIIGDLLTPATPLHRHSYRLPGYPSALHGCQPATAPPLCTATAYPSADCSHGASLPRCHCHCHPFARQHESTTTPLRAYGFAFVSSSASASAFTSTF